MTLPRQGKEPTRSSFGPCLGSVPAFVPDPRLMEAVRMMRRLRRAHPGRSAWIYAIQAGDDGPVKIGVTDSPCDRLTTLQQGNAEELRGLAAWRDLKEVEKWLHEDFAHARIRGEWFHPVPELIAEVLLHGADFSDWDRV